MSCSPFDLRDYFLQELPSPQRLQVEAHVKTCHPCREELERLQLTEAALFSLRDEEIPQRIAFVSDQFSSPRPCAAGSAASGDPRRAWGSPPLPCFPRRLSILLQLVRLPRRIARRPLPWPPCLLPRQEIQQQIQQAVAKAVAKWKHARPKRTNNWSPISSAGTAKLEE